MGKEGHVYILLYLKRNFLNLLFKANLEQISPFFHFNSNGAEFAFDMLYPDIG